MERKGAAEEAIMVVDVLSLSADISRKLNVGLIVSYTTSTSSYETFPFSFFNFYYSWAFIIVSFSPFCVFTIYLINVRLPSARDSYIPINPANNHYGLPIVHSHQKRQYKTFIHTLESPLHGKHPTGFPGPDHNPIDCSNAKLKYLIML